MGDESAVKVYVRVRPLIAREESAASENEPVQLFWKTDKKSIHQIDDGNGTKSFSFDRVFAAEATTSHLYQEVAKPLVVSTVEGYNGTIFAYGQTSSGKTFTMMGSDHNPGVIPLAVEDVFQTIKNCPKKEFLLRVSYMEIYNETVTDLLVDSWKRKPLEVREAMNKTIYVADLTEELVTSPAQALAWIRKGEKNRSYGKTKMNQRSSRSHAIFRMILESRERSDPASGESADGAIIVSHLNLVDLAGSERASQTGAEGTRFKEGCNINRSLFTLGQVIKKLTDESQKGFTNYRDSKLTRILQNSLGGNAKTVIICTVTLVALDETLSTLQFASTAKKMKNDPHVTEVSDDGALLKRYRNEIVDLKRRLHEVSSVTQTTVTEKEVLAHLLQEKDQLQREQEDRIRNLTRIMVTSSNLVPVKKMPKRRVTWGGKIGLARPSLCAGGSSDLSFAEPFTRKRKADRSCLMEMTEDDDDFDAPWDIQEEPSDEMETTQSSVTVRSFEYSPKHASSEWTSELSQKVSNLELQLEMESQQKEEALTKVTELQLQLHTELQLKREALEDVETTEKRAAECELLQLTEAQQKLEAMEEAAMLNLRVEDLERQLETAQSHGQTENEQMKKEFAETVQLLQTQASDKDLAFGERDYLRQELGNFIERIELLEKEKAALTQELEEKGETDEFKSLEEEFRKEQENELKGEMLSLKKALESSEVKCLQLQNKVETLSEELKKKSDFAEELQTMSGKDLVQEVAKLRRSLDDAEGVSRDTKKEWAFLRSRNIALEEMNVTFTADHKRMEAEVNSLCSQLEKEKSRSKKMQSDLQKELNVAFKENTKLTALLDGKVPKELMDTMQLETAATSLRKELAASREEEEALRAQLEELASLRTLPHQMDAMAKQLEESEQQRASALNRLNEMEQLVQILEEKLADSEVSRSTEEDISRELQEQVEQLTEELQSVQAEKEALLSEQDVGAQSRLLSLTAEKDHLLSTVTSLSAEKDQLLSTVTSVTAEKDQLLSTVSSVTAEKDQLLSTVTSVTAEKDQLLSTVTSLSAEKDQLLSTVTSVTAEKDQLLSTVTSVTAEKDQLLSTLTSVTAEKDQLLSTVTSLSAEKDQLLSTVTSVTAEKDHLLSTVTSVTAEKDQLLSTVTSLSAEKDQLLSTVTSVTAEKEQLLSTVTSVTAEKDQLLSTVTSVTAEKDQLLSTVTSVTAEKDHLLSTVTSVTAEKDQLLSTVTSLSAEKDQLLSTVTSVTAEKDQLRRDLQHHDEPAEEETRASAEELQKLLSDVAELSAERDQLKIDLQENIDMMIENQAELRTALERNGDLKEQIRQLEAAQTSQQDASLTEMCPQLQMQCDFQLQLGSQPQSLQEELDAQQHLQIQELEKHLETTKEEVDQLRTDLQDNIEQMIENQDELRASQEKVRVLQEQSNVLRSRVAELESRTSSSGDAERLLQMQELHNQIKSATEELEDVKAERDRLLSERTTCLQSTPTEEVKLPCLTEEMLNTLRQEKQQLREELEDKVETLQSEVRTLTEKLQCAETERDHLRSEVEANCRSTSSEEEKLLCLSEEREHLQETLDTLRREKQQLEDEMETLQSEVRTLTEKLQCAETERDHLRSELEANCQSTSSEEEKLLCLSEEREHLQETLDALRREKQQLGAELETLQSEAAQLNASLTTITEQKNQLEDALQHIRDTASTTQERLRSVQEELSEHKQKNADLQRLSEEKEGALVQQIKTLAERVEEIEAEQNGLLSEEKEKLLCLREERDLLQETLNTLRQEEQQLRAELEDKVETLQSEVRTLTEKLQCSETERDHLRSELEANCQSTSSEEEKLNTLRQEKQQLREELEDRMETLQSEVRTLTEKLQCAETERDHLRSEVEANCQSTSSEEEKLLCLSEEREHLQETLDALRREKQQLEDEMETLQSEVRSLTEKLLCAETERDHLRSELEANCRSTSSEEEKLLCLSEEREHLQETLDTLRREKQQLGAELEDKLDTISTIEENLSRQEQSEREQKAKLQQEVQQLEEQLQMCRDKLTHAGAEAGTSQQLLSEANATISALTGTGGVKETLTSQLHDSTEQLQESFRGFKNLIDTCCRYKSVPLVRGPSAANALPSFPNATMDACTSLSRLGLQIIQSLGNIIVCVQDQAESYRDLFDQLVTSDLAVFEERRLQDVLLCRVQAPALSLGDVDFHSLWGHRLTELLDKRQLYKQKMATILERLWAYIAPHCSELSAEIQAKERFTEQLRGTLSTHPFNDGELDAIFHRELERAAAQAHNKKMTLQSIPEDQAGVRRELLQLLAHAQAQLKEERSKSSTLLQGLDGVPLKAELSLLKDNQQLLLQLQQTEEEVQTLKEQNVQLQEAQVEADSRVSIHKEATQLLQTELQDSRAHSHEKEATIQTLRNTLKEHEKKMPPSAAELEKLQTKLLKMEVELTSASDKHQQEIHRMNTVLRAKEDSLRKLKETLRSQQQESSFLQGEDLHTKLTNPRGSVMKSSVLLDKAKLEEEVKQLKLKIIELESSVSTLQTEMGKWKSRAIKLKVKSKAEVDRPSSPCTPTKRCLPLTSESSTLLCSPKKFVVTPKKILESSRRLMDSPNITLPNSPKSRFFDVGESSDLLSRSCPKQFFDNSGLGTIPDADGAARKEWWPQSPKQEDMCPTQ